MAQASPADKDIQPGTGPCGLSGPHHYLPVILAEIPVVTRRQVEQMKKQAPPAIEPLSLTLGLVLGVIIGVIIWEGRDRR